MLGADIAGAARQLVASLEHGDGPARARELTHGLRLLLEQWDAAGNPSSPDAGQQRLGYVSALEECALASGEITLGAFLWDELATEGVQLRAAVTEHLDRCRKARCNIRCCSCRYGKNFSWKRISI